jgi:Cu+-exporting ATPase
MNPVELTVIGMTCQGCKTTVETVLQRVPGAEDVKVDLKTGLVVISGDADPDALAQAVVAAGFDVAPN